MQSDGTGHAAPDGTAFPAGSWRRNGTDRYGSLSIALHWLMAVLFVAVYATVELRVVMHATAGPDPTVRPEPRRWQALAARLMHVALYLLMIVMPLAGWLILSAEGRAVPFFGLQLPALVGENKELAGLAEGIHETAGTAGYWLIGLHAAAALFHHYVVRDNTLRRMLPLRN